MDGHLLQDIVTVFGLAIVVLLVCHRLHIPSIVGFLLTGVLCGPYGTSFVSVTSDVQLLADIGVVLLLFSVGLEFSLKRFLDHKRFFLFGGFLQVILTILSGFAVSQFMGRSLGESIFLGFLLSLSSTAIVLRTLDKKQEVTTPHGKASLGILIFQDIAVVPMMLLTPYLAGDASELDDNLLIYFLKGVGIMGGVFIAATKIVPSLMHLIARTKSRELFILATLTICFSVAWISFSLGLSLPLGAFLAGLIVSETEYRNEAIDDILPFQDVFTSFFFISIGMLLNLDFILTYPIIILLIAIGVVLLKFGIITMVSLFMRLPLRTAILTGVALSQVGEFSFVLARSGITLGVSDNYHFQLFLAVAVLTMAFTPFMIKYSPQLADLGQDLPIPEQIKGGVTSETEISQDSLKEHVIIVGFGLPGRILAATCKEAKIPYIIVDMDPALVAEKSREAEPIVYGDATHKSVLKHVNINYAQSVAILINDSLAALRIVEHARHLNEDVYIIVRTRRMDEMKSLFQLGADEVIPDEFGSSVEVFARILRKNNIDPDEIRRIVAEQRHDEFEMIRHLYKEPTALLSVGELSMGTILVENGSPLIGMKILDRKLKEHYHVNPIMIRRSSETIMEFDEKTEVQLGDTIVIVGPQENLDIAVKELSV